MFAGLQFAFLGDVLINCDFIIGAATFALGHICFVIAYYFLQKLSMLDLILGGILFVGALIFLLFCPLLIFENPLFKLVCIAYAMIISLMCGKAIGNLIKKQSTLTIIITTASMLFFFSDLMLVFGMFIGIGNWTGHVCMGTYYPALCLLAFSMCIKTIFSKKVV